MSPLTFSLLPSLIAIAALSSTSSTSTPCNELCGPHRLPFPFHLNPACGPPIPTFHLTCVGNRSLYLSLPVEGRQGPTTSSSDLLRVISFVPSSSSLLLDYSRRSSPSLSPCDRWYSDVGSRLFDSSPFLSVTAANLLRLYDCEDSSVCLTGCDDGGCESATSRGCCYPLADGSVWKVGDGFGVFREYGCRGFSSWVERGGGDRSDRVERGIEMEWALPHGFRNGTECADGAVLVNATAVKGGVRCSCGPGFVGDGFAAGSGCFRCE